MNTATVTTDIHIGPFKIPSNGQNMIMNNYADRNGRLEINKKVVDRVVILDSSSSEILPTPNPTFYFLARSLLLMRQFVYDNKNSK